MYTHPILQKLLEQIDDLPFSRPVTGYLTDTYIRGSCAYGISHKHVQADRFSDGDSIHTSAIVQVEREGPFWVLHTLSGSFYVILSFNILKGAQSLDDYLHRLLTMEYPEPWQLH
ncbi:hypothetical protein DVJ81_24825 [Pseudomonas aeruginosa]|jgi:hypothetical protein|nr:hypothetical protein CXP40_07155 [Pseudomonas sp. YY-1]RDC79497.1 hypothetical protein DVJ81_24825 [Pseudomonas aeruginosa]